MKWNHNFKLVNDYKTYRIYESDNNIVRIDFFKSIFRVAIYKKDAYLFPTFSVSPGDTKPSEFGRDRLDQSGLDSIKMDENIRIDDIDIKIDLKNFRISYYKGNKLLFADRDILSYNFDDELGNGSYHYLTRMENEKIFGLGDKTGDINKSLKYFKLETSDSMGFNAKSSDPLYKQIPFYICQNDVGSYGIYYDTYSNGEMDFGREINNYYPPYKYAHFEENSLVYYVIFGNVKSILSRFMYMTGKTNLPPKWSFKYTASTMSYTDANDTENKLNEFLKLLKKYKIDCGGFYLSSGYTEMDGKRYVFHWNKDKIKSPTKLSNKFLKNGIHFLPNVKPAFLTSHPLYEKIAKRGFFLHYKDGSPALFPFWGGVASYLDFTNIDAYNFWSECVKNNLVEKGYESIWNDNNEYDIKDENVYANGFGHEIKARLIRPLFPLLMSRASFDAVNNNKRVMSVSRSGCAGITRTSQTWTGDNYTSFNDFRENHKMLMTLSLSGFILAGQDIGGFYGPSPSKELFLRWIQYGLFTPRFTLHSWKEGVEPTMPWLYQDLMPIVKKLFNFRKELVPYLYSEANRSIEEYEPLVSPLFLKYPSYDTECDYFMCGSSILVCPVFDEGVNKITIDLPSQDNWFYNDEIISGSVTLKAPFKGLPIFFIKASSIIPLDKENTEFNIYTFNNESFIYKYYDDEGTTNNYRTIKVDCLDNEIIVSGIKENETVVLHYNKNRRLLII